MVHILDAVFPPEFRELAPESSRNTLRSHMTSGWFLTLSSLWEKRHLPIRLFSIDRCFRREQEEGGPTRLMTYHSASCVVAGEDVTLEEGGKAISEALLSAFGFTEFRFQPDEKRSKYYMPETQTEVYARHPVLGWVEVATFGIYSPPSALAEYGIGVPVMNLGLGGGAACDDRLPVKRRPPAHLPAVLPTGDLRPRDRRRVHLREEPRSVAGKQMAEAIRDVAAEHATAPGGPCAFTAWKGEIAGREVEVIVEEPESNTKLCGPACANEVYVHDGSVLGVPDIEKWAKVRQEGVSTGITYLDAVSSLAAARIEEAARCGEGTHVQVKMSKLPSDVNLRIEEYAMRYITDHNKKVDLRGGPVFLTVRSVIPGGQPTQ